MRSLTDISGIKIGLKIVTDIISHILYKLYSWYDLTCGEMMCPRCKGMTRKDRVTPHGCDLCNLGG